MDKGEMLQEMGGGRNAGHLVRLGDKKVTMSVLKQLMSFAHFAETVLNIPALILSGRNR
jgi:hypothetical protein